MSVDNSQGFILGLRLGIGWPRERVPNKVFPDSESELKLSEATVPGGSVASLWLKVFCSNK